MLPLRDHLHNDNMALALVVPVLIAGVIGGRWPGALSAIAAALCFDFFFTQPYQSLRIASGNDIASIVVLLIVALISAEVGIRARRGGHSARESRSDLDRLLPRHRARGARRRHRRRRLVGPRRADRPVRPRSTAPSRPAPSAVVAPPARASTARSRVRSSSRPTPTSCSRRAASSSRWSGAARVRPARAVRVGVGAGVAPEAARRGRDRRRARHHARHRIRGLTPQYTVRVVSREVWSAPVDRRPEVLL